MVGLIYFCVILLLWEVNFVIGKSGFKKERNIELFKQRYNYSVTALVEDFGNKSLPYVRFIHVPKTGTSFAATIAHYCCDQLDFIYIDVLIRLSSARPMPWKWDPTCLHRFKQPITKNGNWWSHIPVREEDLRDQRNVIMLREPISRLSSQLVHMKILRGRMVAFGFTKDDAFILELVLSRQLEQARTLTNDSMMLINPSDSPVLYQQYHLFLQHLTSCIKDISTIRSFCHWQVASMFPGIRNCQTKMILGKECSDKNYMVNEPDFQMAMERIDTKFAFVGIQEHWNDSILAFHRLFGGKLFEDEFLQRRSQVRVKLVLTIPWFLWLSLS